MVKSPKDFSDFQYRNRSDKAVMFFSASSVEDTRMLLSAGIYDILVSYHYISKAPRVYEEELLPEIYRNGGLFMTDSGAFSFFNNKKIREDERAYHPGYWERYLNEYCEWIYKNMPMIYCVANLDLDNILGREDVDKWNETYFKPMGKQTQVIYVVHESNDYADHNGMKRLREYLDAYEYVGVNQMLKGHAAKIYTEVKNAKRRVHGFAWTALPLLKPYPFFSVDSTTWLGGMRYGTTYKYDGKNFKVIDYKKKYRRAGTLVEMEKKGIDRGEIRDETRFGINRMNLEGWKGARKEFLKMANLKLLNKNVHFYDKRTL